MKIVKGKSKVICQNCGQVAGYFADDEYEELAKLYCEQCILHVFKESKTESFYYRKDGTPGWRRDRPYDEGDKLEDQESAKSSSEKPSDASTT